MILSPIEQSIKQKIEAIGTPLKDWDIKINRGILTGCNDAFIIDEAKKEELIKEDPKSAEIIRPILRGRDIKRYGYDFAGLYLIATHNGIPEKGIPRIKIDDYPAIKRHLNKYKREINARYDKGDTPYNLRSCAYWEDFSKPKIVWGNLCLSAQFSYTEERFFINAPSPMIVPGNKYILAVLNSKLGDWYIRHLGVIRNGGYFEYKPMFIERLPIPQIAINKQKHFVAVVDNILTSKNNCKSTKRNQSLLDEMVFQLYGLTAEEISYILSFRSAEVV